MNVRPVLWIVVPCYNESEVLPVTEPLFADKLAGLERAGLVSSGSRVLFVDDGSSDGTWDLIRGYAEADERIIGIRQSRNRGHQKAVLAGLMEARGRCDVTISIDCDGQDDLDAMDEMMRAYLDGCEVVYGVREKRDTDTFFKRATAQGFYRFLNAMGAETVYNHADYRLISSTVLQHLADYREVNLFLRGMVPLVGFRSTTVLYERAERKAGRSHYPLSRMIALAVDGITSLSILPIRIISTAGLIVSLFGVISIIWAVIRHVTGHTVAGWASIICILSLIGGLQLLSLGVIGEYVGKTYLEAKGRPRYIISDRTWEPFARHYVEEEGARADTSFRKAGKPGPSGAHGRGADLDSASDHAVK